VPQATRRFLKPLVGIDPAEVHLYRGETAAQVTAARQADAVTVGDNILLAPGQAADDPRGAALLAHELTHVARRREPAFVPPVIGGAPPSTDDETLAAQVESNVRSAAQGNTPDPAFQTSMPTTRPEPAAPSDLDSAGSPGPWNGLPAPWEPLPAWLTTRDPAPRLGAANGHAPATASPALAAAPAAPAPVLYAAETGRDLPPPENGQEPASHGEDSSHAASGAVEPDLDALARQVYTLLRRRLASERRRL